MLTNLHVKNMALIDEADIDFGDGLNILTGETGAGKSIILGSINIALGGKVGADVIRKGCDYALTELTFQITNKDKLAKLTELGVEELDEGTVIISRKITPAKSTIKINGETFTLGEVKNISHILIDIHGQHDNQVLLKENTHIDMVDLYGADKISPLLENYVKLYKKYNEISDKIDGMSGDEADRNRQIDLLEYQINEIESASLKDGEDDELESTFKKMSNYQKIATDLSSAKQLLSEDDTNVSGLLGTAVKLLTQAAGYDDTLVGVADTLSSAEDLVNDSLMEISDYIDAFEFSEEEYANLQERLNLINSLKLKYGRTISDILDFADNSRNKLNELSNFNEIFADLQRQLAETEDKLEASSKKLSEARKKSASALCKAVSVGLKELNFLNNEFESEFETTESFTAKGTDKMHFLISTNIGEDLKPLSKVASGGELSRIMLAFKTVMADKDDTDTLIFDEIDAGISGITAQMVGEKLSQLSRSHQIICITHLPQIAAMADEHYIIEKTADNTKTVTDIHSLTDDESIGELARLLGGAKITEAALNNAREMKKLANKN
jgi:DNA repair protein RecN (Recombination protein N)